MLSMYVQQTLPLSVRSYLKTLARSAEKQFLKVDEQTLSHRDIIVSFKHSYVFNFVIAELSKSHGFFVYMFEMSFIV